METSRLVERDRERKDGVRPELNTPELWVKEGWMCSETKKHE